MDQVAIQYAQDAAAACDPGSSGEGIRRLPHPAEQRAPGLLFCGEDEEDVIGMHSLVWWTVILG